MDKLKIYDINESVYQFAGYLTGGGSSFISNFLCQSGASKSVIFLDVPYNQKRFDQTLGGSPDKYASQDAANKLATRAYLDTVKLTGESENKIGIGLSAVLKKDNERQGRQHFAYLSLVLNNHLKSFEIQLPQEQPRAYQEELLSKCILEVLYAIIFDRDLHEYINLFVKHASTVSIQEELLRVYVGDSDFNYNDSDQSWTRPVIFPGSFNPVHSGHIEVAKVATDILNVKPIFEISLFSLGKPLVDYYDLNKRLDNFEQDIIVTNKASFVDKTESYYKSLHFDDLVYVVGIDTWERISYHELMVLREYNVRFLVFGRDGKKLFKPAFEIIVEDCLIRNSMANDFNFEMSSNYLRKGL